MSQSVTTKALLPTPEYFTTNARHGLRARQFDVTWLFIRGFQKLGLVSHVKLPTEAAKRRLALPSTSGAASA